MQVFCPECGARTTLSPERWRCDCGGAWEPVPLPDIAVDEAERGVWRYHQMYGLEFDQPHFRMGSGDTPLLPLDVNGREIHLKLEYMAPTASFKDRGAEVMVNILKHQGVQRVVDDSSGNAGAAVAANAARAGLAADIFVPAYASSAKQAQIAIYGAQVHPTPGPRGNAKIAALALAEAEPNAALASHAYHPGFLAGQESLAWELWEQLGGRAPHWYVTPVGQGVHLLGVWLGFRRLLDAGLIASLPHMIAVQPTLLAPVKRALDSGLNAIPPMKTSRPSLAEGLAIAAPIRGARLLQAIRETGGDCITGEEDEIVRAQQVLARHGFYVEPTSAAAFAALDEVLARADASECIVLPLTGSGLKGSPHV
jgi:threonine synthase